MNTYIVTVFDHEANKSIHRYAVAAADVDFAEDLEELLGGRYRGRIEVSVETLDTFTPEQIRMIRV